MPKFTLIAEHTDLYGKPDGTKVNYEFYVDSLDNVLEHVDLFIRGCGYNPSGTLDYVADEEYYGTGPEWYNEEFETPTDAKYNPDQNSVGHSAYFFDTERNK
jgi:hypothetical protein